MKLKEIRKAIAAAATAGLAYLASKGVDIPDAIAVPLVAFIAGAIVHQIKNATS